MKNIFKENKRLKKEVEELKDYNKRLERENTEGYIRLKEYYDHCKDEELKWIKTEYSTKIERKKQVEEIAKALEKRIKDSLKMVELDVTTDVNCYLKILDFLKGE